MLRITAYLTLIWAVMLPFSWPEDAAFFYYRMQVVMLSGILAFGYMTAAMLLAIRPGWLEKRLHGLDKMYLLHKRLGIGSVITLSAHWFAYNSGKWLVMSGVLQRPKRAEGGHQLIEGVDWPVLAKLVGEWAFYLFLLFAAVSLIQAISYKKFAAIHKLAGVIYIAAAFHSILLLKTSADFIIYNIATVVMAIAGVYCAYLSLSGQIGRNKRITGNVYHTQKLAGNTVQLKIQLNSPLNYKPGQFVYLDFLDGEKAHPFTVVHYDSNEHTLEIAIKALGDYTTALYNTLRDGQPVSVEGGYGQFQIPDVHRQVWIGAGIGITPFIAWLESMAASYRSGVEKVVFYYCARNSADAFFAQRLHKLSAPFANVELIVLLADEGKLLTPEEIAQRMGDNTDYSVSFCGPQAFADSIKQGLAQTGWSCKRFHSEIFTMR